MNDVFISYKREDKPYARAVAEVLTARGLHVWWDVDLLPGDRFADEIQSVIAQSKLTVVLWSARSVVSTWVRAEARAALETSQLLPVRLDAAVIPLPFNDLHTLDLSDWDGQASSGRLSTLAAAVAARLGLPDRATVPAADPLPGPEAQRRLHDHDHEVEIWRRIKTLKDPSKDALEKYLRNYPDGLFADLARYRLNQIQRGQVWRRSLVWAGGTAAVLGAVVAFATLVLERPQLPAVLAWARGAGEGEAASAVSQQEQATPLRALTPSERLALRVADDGLLNIARPPSMVPVFIEQFFNEEPKLVKKEDQPERRAAILSALGLDEDGGDAMRQAVMRAGYDRLVADYRARLPGDILQSLPLVAPPLRLIIGGSQRPDALTCERAQDFLHFHRTYTEALTIFRAAYLGAFGVNDVFAEQIALLNAPSWANGERFNLPVPQPSYAQDMGLDLFLKTGTVAELTPMLVAEIEGMDPDWRERIAQFADDMLAYRTAYSELIVSFGRTYFKNVYRLQAVDDAPNPFGCVQTAQHMLTFEFEFKCGAIASICAPVTSFYLRDPDTDEVFRPASYPGLHQAILMFWHRRAEAGTDPQMVSLLKTVAALRTETPLDFRDIDRAIRAGIDSR